MIRLFGLRLPRAIPLWLLVLTWLIAAHLAYPLGNLFSWIIILTFFLIMPGYLFLTAFIKRRWTPLETLSFSVGLSVFLLMLAGLLLNSLLLVGIERPLTTINIFGALDIITLILLAFTFRQMVKLPRKLPSISYPVGLLLLTSLSLPILAVCGAVMQNNGGSNILTLILFAIIAVLFLVLLKFRSLSPYYPFVLFMFAMAILFTTSLRGWGITGHDIQREWAVFQMTMSNEAWNIALFRDPYNACLSITILPTMIAKITAIPDAYIFKVVFQIIAAYAVIPAYYFITRLHGARDGLLAGFIFLLFPTFLNDMPMLNRQEIAFLFFGLIMLLMLLAENSKRLQWFTVLLIIALTFSHYSSSYIMIALMATAWVTHKILRMVTKSKYPSTHVTALPLLRLPMILAACVCVFMWNVSITQTTSGLSKTIDKTVAGLLGRSNTDSRANDVKYSLLGGGATDPNETLRNFTNPFTKGDVTVTNIPEATIPYTALGSAVASVIPLDQVHAFIRNSFAKVLQLLLVIGCIVMWGYIRFKRYHAYDLYILSLCGGSILLLVAVSILPQLSVDYGVLRLFQQLLFILALPIIAAVIWMLSRIIKFPNAIYMICGVIFAFMFLHTSGFIPQITGGYKPQLSLNNIGSAYDAYYIPENELLGSEWINTHNKDKTAVAIDIYAPLRFTKKEQEDMVVTSPFVPSTRAYVYHYKTPDTFIVNVNSNLYYYKVDRKTARENMLYTNGESYIGKLVEKQ